MVTLKKCVGILIVLIALLILIPFSVYSHFGYSTVKYDLAIDINTNATNEFTIYLPAPVDNSDVTSKVGADLKITKGKGDVAIIDTLYGPAIRIDGTGNMELESKGLDRAYFYDISDYSGYDLSMEREDLHSRENWVYLDSDTNGSLTLTYNFQYRTEFSVYGDDASYRFSGIVFNNWSAYSFHRNVGFWDGSPEDLCCMTTVIYIAVIITTIFISLKVRKLYLQIQEEKTLRENMEKYPGWFQKQG